MPLITTTAHADNDDDLPKAVGNDQGPPDAVDNGDPPKAVGNDQGSPNCESTIVITKMVHSTKLLLAIVKQAVNHHARKPGQRTLTLKIQSWERSCLIFTLIQLKPTKGTIS